MKQLQNLRLQLGKEGEDLAAIYLREHGYSIIQRNFKAHYGELDIITIFQKQLVFVEVKTRIGREFGLPEEGVTSKKLREIIKTAEFYKSLHPELPDEMQVDIIAIELKGDRTVKYFNHLQSVTAYL